MVYTANKLSCLCYKNNQVTQMKQYYCHRNGYYAEIMSVSMINSVRGSSQACSASSSVKTGFTLGGDGTPGMEFPWVNGAILKDRKSQQLSSVITSPHNSASCIHVRVNK